jgi:hypothetical protein
MPFFVASLFIIAKSYEEQQKQIENEKLVASNFQSTP